MKFNAGFDIETDTEKLIFHYGPECFGPEVEQRRLDDIRQSLKNPSADGPSVLYAIAMDVGKKKHLADLKKRNLLYGAVIYSKGRIGNEPVRSQGHIHAISNSCNSSTPEVYEIWEGEAVIYMQETAEDNPGRCFAVHAKTGDVVIVPPSWAHCTVNANTNKNMAFGAWCVRDYGFDYKGVREHGGVAYFPTVQDNGHLAWSTNPSYQAPELIVKAARTYPEFGIERDIPIYTQYENNPNLFAFVTDPESVKDIWINFEP
ncbi:glucose-6-phosphate isomerase family protein [Peribacillus loiseleuriae]|uniref:glucose-6-phosphate isomerase n=1 Tax=Peribacillus loiseleuriae TaxID=1679170 RepID=A0A0K9GTI9_9BACI|nr:glucose-6-phosphate isomerase family protein [Peribacillus loiseleuriae]KMY49975.1 glucose-6-phosphate isomerase [Peribacillus loiseleuriae]